LHDPAVVDRQIAREVADAEARRKKTAVPTAKTEAQTKYDEDRLKKEIKDIEVKAKEKNSPRVRPLSESKAIETGANFISEGFLFCVAGGIIVFEYFRSSRKESNRRDEVKERLSSIESKIERIESSLGIPHEELEANTTEIKTIGAKEEAPTAEEKVKDTKDSKSNSTQAATKP
jgi:optic atrophy 3 protein